MMLMVSHGAGGATDFQARIVPMTAGNEDALGMPVAIIIKPGAGGRVSWNWFATQADADHHTMGAYNIPHSIAQSIKIPGVFDLERNAVMEDVPTMAEQGFDIDNASVNFRSVLVPKGTPRAIIDKLAVTVPAMFENGGVAKRMKAGGSPMHIMTRDEVSAMLEARQATLTEVLSGLKNSLTWDAWPPRIPQSEEF